MDDEKTTKQNRNQKKTNASPLYHLINQKKKKLSLSLYLQHPTNKLN